MSIPDWPRELLQNWLRDITSEEKFQDRQDFRQSRSANNLVSRLVSTYGENAILDYFARPDVQEKMRNDIPQMNTALGVSAWLNGPGTVPPCLVTFFLDFEKEQ